MKTRHGTNSFLWWCACVAHQDLGTCSCYRSFKGNTIRGNNARNSERKMALWERLWEGLWKPSKNLWKPLETSEALPLRDPLRGRFPSQNLSGLLPLFLLPLNLSPKRSLDDRQDYSSNLCPPKTGGLGLLYKKTTRRRPKTPPNKSYSKCFRRPCTKHFFFLEPK